MAKTIIPYKLIISQDGQGNISDALLQYQINTDGSVPNIFNTVSVRAALTDAIIQSLFTTAINAAKTSEGI